MFAQPQKTSYPVLCVLATKYYPCELQKQLKTGN